MLHKDNSLRKYITITETDHALQDLIQELTSCLPALKEPSTTFGPRKLRYYKFKEDEAA